jgi:hypothetical protein
MHNKPTLAESKTIWKMTADAFSVSTDEGKTWNAGIDSSGNAVVNVLSAVGVQAEWIEATDLSVIGANISGFKMYDGYLTRQVDLYPDMTADGLADLTDDTIVTRIINIRAGKSATADAILVYDKTKAQYLNNSGYNVEYRLRYDGYMYCKNASVSGEIEAKTGTIGNFTITDGNLTAEGEKGKISFESDEEEAGYINLDGQNMTIGGWYIAIRGRSVEVDATAGGLSINGDFYATGTKSRSVETSNYGKILQYCYEMPSPMFGDIGTGIIDDTGKCYIYLEEMFSETVSSDCEYYVFLQKEGQGDLWIEENAKGYFIVSGTPGLRFSWEAKARQKDYEYERLEPAVSSNEEPEVDYEEQAINYLENYEKELYGYEEIN